MSKKKHHPPIKKPAKGKPDADAKLRSLMGNPTKNKTIAGGHTGSFDAQGAPSYTAGPDEQ